MAENKKVDLLDYMIILVKWKRFLLFFFIISMVISYLAIYFFVNERFESTALLLPSSEQNSSSILSGLSGLSGLKVFLLILVDLILVPMQICTIQLYPAGVY